MASPAEWPLVQTSGMDTGAVAHAIRLRRVIELTYRGDPAAATRVVQPHALFRTTAGGLALEALQVAGHTSSGSLPAWRQFQLMRIVNARVLNDSFDPAQDFDLSADKYRLGVIVSV